MALTFVTLVLVGVAEAKTPEGGRTPGVTVTVVEADNLLASQSVTVSGAGFHANTAVDIQQCAVASPQPCTSPVPVMATSSGSFSTLRTVTRMFSPEGGGPAVDCLTTACVIEATDVQGSNAHHHLTFSGPAAVTTSPATAVAASAATLNGTVNPRGLSTDSWFEYSTSPDLAQPSSTIHTTVGSGNAPASVSQDVSGLSADTTYYFRTVADRSGTVARGEIASFRTSAAGGPSPPAGPDPPSGPGPPTPGDSDPPRITDAAADRVWKLASALTPLTAAARTVKSGTTFRYTLSESATATIAVDRVLPGRRAGLRCVKPNRTNRRNRRCSRYKRVVVLARVALAGPNQTPFSGRWRDSRNRRRALTPGGYRATITATDAAGNTSTPRRLGFKVVRR